jgi:hypothetical protein
VCKPKQTENGGNIITKAVIGNTGHSQKTTASNSNFAKTFHANAPTDMLFEINSEILKLNNVVINSMSLSSP